ncbi:MAG: MATE family efflux transporter [Pseudomonadota bacterium]
MGFNVEANNQLSAGAGKLGFFDVFRRALRGEEVDVTSVPLKRAIAFLAIPMIAEMCMESLFVVTDIFWVASLGANAVAVVGITESIIVLLEAIGVGVGMAVTAMIARRIGEKRPEDAAYIAGQALWVGGLVAITFGVLGAFYATDILALMGAAPDVIAQGAGFTRILLGGSVTLMYLFLLSAAFRGAGEPAIAMRALWLGNGLNIVLDPLLIFGVGPFPEFGVEGAAIASVIGRGTGALYLMYRLFAQTPRLPMSIAALKLHGPTLKRLLEVSAGGVAQFIIGMASWIVLMRLMASYGSEAVAGYTIAIRVIVFCLLPAWGMANAAATLVGQNLGAEKPERAERAVWLTVKYNVWFMGVLAVIFGFGAPVIVSVFTAEPAVSDYAVMCLRILAGGYVIYAIGMIVVQAFNGAGDTRTPTWLNALCFWVFQLPFAYWLAEPLGLGPTGVFIAMIVTQLLLTIGAVVLFRRGRWKEVTV